MEVQHLQAELERDGVLVLDRLRHWVQVAGEHPCIFYGETDRSISYREFNDLTDSVAGNLARLGIAKGDYVSVYMRNQLNAIIAMFGIWKAGAVFAPINFGLAGRLLRYQLDDTKPSLLIVERALIPALNEIWTADEATGQVVIHDPQPEDHDYQQEFVPFEGNTPVTQWAALLETARPPEVTLEFDDCANIIYTSGTTGPAKGVVQPHRWMNQYTFMFRQLLNQDDVVYNDLPMHHVGGAVFNIVRAIWAGCTIGCWDRFSPNQFWDRVRRANATSAVLVDTMISWLAKADPKAEDHCNTLRKVHMQPLPARHHEISRRFGFDFVTCGFGQTESGLSCYAIIEETDVACETPAEFQRGRPRAEIRQLAQKHKILLLPFDQAPTAGAGFMGEQGLFMEAAVLDERDQHCPPDVAGQLAFRPRLPALIMQEYLGKPAATTKAFSNLWFHTGDSARRTAQGAFYFMDRMGDRIRVRGENTSTFHVEDLINQCPGVAMSAAFGVPAQEGYEDDIAVCIVIHSGQSVDEKVIAQWAMDNMPKFMWPRHIRIVSDLPRTLTQKIEKFKLKQALIKELGLG